MTSAYEGAAEDHLRRLDRLIDRGGVARLKKLYDDAQAKLEKKLAASIGRSSSPMSVHQYRVLLAQVRQGQMQIAGRLGDESARVTVETQTDALHGIVTQIKKLEAMHDMPAATLPIEEAARFAGVIDKHKSSLLAQNKSSMARYGVGVVRKIEDNLAMTLATGGSVGEAVETVATTADLEWWRAARIVRCLPGETLVTGAMVGAVTRRWHEGPMLEIVAERGRKLTTTPNHPVLTTRGWLPAGELCQGDYLIRDGGLKDVRPTRDEHVTGRPSTISEVFDAAATVGVIDRRRGTRPDFHGDGADGDVDISRPDRLLMFGVFSALTEPTSKNFFPPSNMLTGRPTFCGCCKRLLPYERACLCSSSCRLSFLAQSRVDEMMIDADGSTDLRGALSVPVTPNDLLVGDRELASIVGIGRSEAEFLRFGRRADIDSGFSYEIPDGLPGDPEFSADSIGTHPVQVELDRVVDLRLRSFRGHVFNITSNDGYFTANGYFVGNTEQSWAAHATVVEGVRASSEALGEMYLRWTELVSDAGHPLDDRVGADSVAMHGQVAMPGHVFTMPSSARSIVITNRYGKSRVDPSMIGQTWLHPPNRPNDRSSVIPWRPQWGGDGWHLVGGERVFVKAPARGR